MISYVISLVSVLTVCSIAVARFKYRPTPEYESIKALHDVRTLLSTKERTLGQQLLGRSLPNLRLVRAFGLTNTFVTPSIDTHDSFVRHARSLMAAATPSNKWPTFSQSTTDVIDHHLSNAVSHPIPFDSFMQCLTLKVVLHTLFRVPVDRLDNAGVTLVAHGINDLWRLSKTTESLPETLLADMNIHLRAWIPDIDNPLDYIIPTFETLWRVVAITVAYCLRDDSGSRHALQDFLECPTKRQFEEFVVDGPSAAAVVAEVMRLHPPTKRISRSYPHTTFFNRVYDFLPSTAFQSTCNKVSIAEVGLIQRDPAIWGPDAETFDPMRHHPDVRTEEQSRSLLGFGLGKLQCVASSWAPLAAGLIAAAIMAKDQDGDLKIVEGAKIGGREGWEDWAIVLNDKAYIPSFPSGEPAGL